MLPSLLLTHFRPLLQPPASAIPLHPQLSPCRFQHGIPRDSLPAAGLPRAADQPQPSPTVWRGASEPLPGRSGPEAPPARRGTDQAELGAGPVHPERDVVAELRERSAALGHRRHGRQEPAEQQRGRAGRPQPAAPPRGRGRARQPQPAAPHAGRRLRRGRAAPPPRRLPAAAINNRGSARRRQRHPGQRPPPQVRGRADTEPAEEQGEGLRKEGASERACTGRE